MAHVITETPVFTPTVTVPDGTDSRVNAAEVVAAIAQSLANRTRSLKAVTDFAALRNAANTFTALNTFNAGLTANAATVTGALTVNGGIKATDGTLELTSTVIAAADVHVTGQLRVNGVLAANDGTINVISELHADDSVYVNVPHLFLAEAVDIVHPTFGGALQPLRLVQVDISRARISQGAPDYDYIAGMWVVNTGGAARLEIPILIPRGTEQWSFQVMWSAAASGETNTAEVWHWTRDYSNLGPAMMADGVMEGSVSESVYTAVPGEAVVNAGPVITSTFAPELERYAVVVRLAGGANNRLFGLRLQFWDPGPRNG